MHEKKKSKREFIRLLKWLLVNHGFEDDLVDWKRKKRFIECDNTLNN